MKRRSFIKGLLAVPFVALASKLSLPSSDAATKPANKIAKSRDCKIEWKDEREGNHEPLLMYHLYNCTFGSVDLSERWRGIYSVYADESDRIEAALPPIEALLATL